MVTQQARGLALLATGQLTEDDWFERKQILLQVMGLDGNPAQADVMIMLCRQHDFDPFLKHIVLIKGKPYVTRDGLMHKAHTSGQFNGIKVDLAKLPDGEWTATCTVYRKDMDNPIVYTVYESEHKPKNIRGGSAWETYPRAMLTKCAEVATLRRAFDIALGAAEELGYDGVQEQSSQGRVTVVERDAAPPAQIAAPAPLTEADYEAFSHDLERQAADGVATREILAFLQANGARMTEQQKGTINTLWKSIIQARKAGEAWPHPDQQQPAAPIEATVVATPPIAVGPLGDGSQPATERQVSFIFAIGREAGLDEPAVDTLARGSYGGDVDQLNRGDAALLIEDLRRQRGESYQRPEAEVADGEAGEDVPFD